MEGKKPWNIYNCCLISLQKIWFDLMHNLKAATSCNLDSNVISKRSYLLEQGNRPVPPESFKKAKNIITVMDNMLLHNINSKSN